MNVDRLLRLSWLLRPDMRRGALPDATIPSDFGLRWLIEGSRDYSVWSNSAIFQNMDLLTPLPDWPCFGRFGMTKALHYLLSQREDLRKEFDVSTEAGLWHAIAWLFTHGVKEHGLESLVDSDTLAALDETPPFLLMTDGVASSHSALTWLMFFVWRCGRDLRDIFDLQTTQGQADYLQWFLFEGISNLQLAPLIAPRWRAWLQQSMTLTESDVPIPRAALLLWWRRHDLRQMFDLREAQGWSALAQWIENAWHAEPELRWLHECAPSESGKLRRDSAVRSRSRPFGVNLVGFAFGELGIGEDVRMAVAACEAMDIPFKVVNIHPGSNLRQGDQALARHVEKGLSGEEEAPYAINVFCLTGFDTARVYLERGLPLFEGRYNIGWWPWELPVWPANWRVAFDLVDEIWAATEFTREMYVKAQFSAAACPLPGKPVTLMPLPVSVARAAPITRRKLQLHEGRFLFLYVFDFNSYLARKNPFAAVFAFRRAFADNDASVGLVLKTMNSKPEDPEWDRFLRECAKDERITVLDETLDRGEVLGLIDACDAYVSLHRSEGFGRTLAEAMLFGKPVVGTDFSGNVDFLKAEAGFPVKWRRRMVKAGEYPFISDADAAWWAEPDAADAAVQMRAARDAAKRKNFAERVRTFAKWQFSPERIGRLMKARLKSIQVLID